MYVVWGRLCFHEHLSVHMEGGRVPRVFFSIFVKMGDPIPIREYGQCTVDTHLTGMHSCICLQKVDLGVVDFKHTDNRSRSRLVRVFLTQ